ncbi:hypothetical protein [Aliivibrio sp.]
MFGIDPYSFETLLPGVLLIATMAGAMIWAFFKVRHLMKQSPQE